LAERRRVPARAELHDILGIRAEPLWSRIYRWPRSNPQYDVGHLAHIDTLEALCPAGLYLAGSAYRGVGIPDCTRQGRDTAAKALAALAVLDGHAPTDAVGWVRRVYDPKAVEMPWQAWWVRRLRS
jgi:hypothetical protein